ncbi:inositol monophosphatase [Candidatus Woesebacteria bacterium RIFCSPHIGHO2_01_FULL_44_21]|uniref:Probable inosine/xanthosine triphosphatase n=1 Tax=Candidatus Woesebacteria bacterium RIFCSPHIGHO2_01_FULL_44_21 TaxID=1802503 RepID=A0A1F7YVZ9_9BACT|nr:MAG: inositol monophosphatase [Candidatus Woesebacteria bacterium RIFCSPHIGHO2_01_FULL_44_21]OGM69480.1 MAG: inositol monophosphatase [Candidatus Woesebacteria bacterium RIFCSPLOWO2_01_FULL_44_24b]
MKRVVVASANPVKINTTEIGFAKMFPEVLFKVEGISAPSGVSDQPMSEEETMIGATNRANNVAKLVPNADYWVGIEGGLEERNGGMEGFAWIVVKSKNGKFGKGRTGAFFLPKKVVQLIKQGKELGEADDIVFGLKNSKQANGAVGILTGDVLTRTTFYEPAVILALIPFKNPRLYD